MRFRTFCDIAPCSPVVVDHRPIVYYNKTTRRSVIEALSSQCCCPKLYICDTWMFPTASSWQLHGLLSLAVLPACTVLLWCAGKRASDQVGRLGRDVVYSLPCSNELLCPPIITFCECIDPDCLPPRILRGNWCRVAYSTYLCLHVFLLFYRSRSLVSLWFQYIWRCVHSDVSSCLRVRCINFRLFSSSHFYYSADV